MSEHQQIQQLIAIYDDLNAAERAWVEAHVVGCSTCAASLLAYQAMDRQLADLPEVRSGADLRPLFYARLDEARRRERWWVLWWQISSLVGQTAVLALIIFVFIGFWWSVREQSPQPVAVLATAVPTVTNTPTALPTTAPPTRTPLPTATPLPIWQMERIQQFTNPQGEVSQIGLAADGSVLAVAGSEQAQVWQTADWQSLGIWTMPPLSGRLRTVNSLALSADGGQLALGSLDYNGYVVVWLLPERSYAHFLGGHGDSISSLAFSADGRFLATGTASNERVVRLWQLADGTIQQQLTFDSTINDLAFAPDGSVLAVGTAAGEVGLWGGAEAEASLVVEDGWITAVAFNDQFVAAGTLDGRLVMWQLGETAVWQELIVSTKAIRTIVFSGDGRLVAAAAADGTVVLWQVEGDGLRELLASETADAASQIIQLAFTDKGLLAVTGMPDGNIEIWQASQQ